MRNPTLIYSLAATTWLASFAPAQMIELRSGEVLIGSVASLDANTVTVDAGFPTIERKAVARDEIAPRSLYALLAARSDATSAAAHLELAAVSESLGLPLHAIAELEQSSRLDPATRPVVERRVRALRERVARDLSDKAQQSLASARPAEAKLDAEVVLMRYADTAAAADAKRVRDDAHKELSRLATGKVVGAEEIKKALVTAGSQLRTLPATPGGVGLTIKEAMLREGAVMALESAWRAVGSIQAGQDVPAGTKDELSTTRARVQAALRDQYLALARNALQRRALPLAESYNGKACALDPMGGGCAHLQDLITQARITNGS